MKTSNVTSDQGVLKTENPVVSDRGRSLDKTGLKTRGEVGLLVLRTSRLHILLAGGRYAALRSPLRPYAHVDDRLNSLGTKGLSTPPRLPAKDNIIVGVGLLVLRTPRFEDSSF